MAAASRALSDAEDVGSQIVSENGQMKWSTRYLEFRLSM